MKEKTISKEYKEIIPYCVTIFFETSKLSPNAKGSEFMALWGISPAISQAVNMNTIYVSNPISFFLLFGLLSILSAICLLFLPKKVIKIISNK
ncbi:MAG: hypothetical protein LBC39_03625 [Methanobrevibacter sp.]|jgi:hypothetical protein|nr:hypothetical protein [Candidatus Methanovirga aequatorialis]